MKNSLIPLDQIQTVPVYYMVAADDEQCTESDAETYSKMIQTSRDTLIYRTLTNHDFLDAAPFFDDLKELLLEDKAITLTGMMAAISIVILTF
jgi:hypothetical protein